MQAGMIYQKMVQELEEQAGKEKKVKPRTECAWHRRVHRCMEEGCDLH